MIRCSVLFAAFALSFGCGSSSAPLPTAPLADSNAASTVELAPDLSPVSAPSELVLIGRLSNPRRLLETLAGWAGMPLQINQALPNELRELEPVFAWDAPIEVVGVLDRRSADKKPEPFLVVSVGLASLESALSLARDRGANPSGVVPGVFRIDPGEDLSCAIAASVGPAPARLVCGAEWPAVEELWPYATRGLPVRDLGTGELQIELTAEPIRRRFAREISQFRAMAALLLRMASLDDKRFDSVLADITYAVADELKALAGEIDRLQWTAKLDASGKALELEQTLVFGGGGPERSFVRETVREMGARATPPPDTFWDLPASANSAIYSPGSDSKRLTTVFQSLAELADAYLEHEDVPLSLRKRARRLLESYPSLVSGGAYATGASPAKTPLASLGWSVGIVNQRADVLTAILSDFSSLLADRQPSALLKARLDWDPKLWPKLRHQATQVKGFPARATVYTLSLPGALVGQLGARMAPGAGSGTGPDATKGGSLTILVVPDGARSFVAYAPEQKQAMLLVEGLRSGKEKRLGDLPTLAALRNRNSVWAGFWTLEALVPHLQAALKQTGEQLLAKAPNHGRSPWLFRVDVSEQPNSLSLSGAVRIPQEAFQDAGSLLPDLARAGF